jgi:photosystem II stability/assembly factor-like uncharacterized protein
MEKKKVAFRGAALVLLAVSVASWEAQGGWTWQRNGTTENTGFFDVAAGDASHAYAPGVIDQGGGNSKGVIMVTSDGGVSWTPSTPDGRQLAIYFSAWAPSPETCYVGGMAKLFKTADGGAGWTESQHPDMIPLKPVMGVGGYGEGFVVATTSEEIFVSHDGGASWTPVPSPLPDASLTHVVFVNATTGWIAAGSGEYDENDQLTGYAGGALLGTTDGGATWTTLRPVEARQYGKPAFINPLEGWITSVSMSGVSLEKTTDGGQTWQPMTLPPFTEGTLSYLGQVVFFDRCEGFLLGSDSEAKKTALYYTTDRGGSWQQQDTAWSQIVYPPEFPFPFPVFPVLIAMGFAGRDLGWVTGTYEFIGRYQADGPGPGCGSSADDIPDSPADAGSDGPGDDGGGGCGCALVR